MAGKGLTRAVFGSVARTGVSGQFFGSVANTSVSDILEEGKGRGRRGEKYRAAGAHGA